MVRLMSWMAFGAGVLSGLVAVSGHAQAADWRPSKPVELVVPAEKSMPARGFAGAVLQAIEAQELLPDGVNLRPMEAAAARDYMTGSDGEDPHALQLLTPAEIHRVLLADGDRAKFRGIAVMAIAPMAVAVSAGSAYQSLGNIVRDARTQPGKIAHGGRRLGSGAHILGVLWAHAAGVGVPYKAEGGMAMLNLLSGRVAFGIREPSEIDTFVQAGKLRVIAVSRPLKRYPAAPTFDEAGFVFAQPLQYRGWWMSAKAPAPAVAFYRGLFDKVRRGEGYQRYLDRHSLQPVWITGERLKALLARERQSYRTLAQELKLEAKPKGEDS